MPVPAIPVSVTCPNCKNTFAIQVRTVIDVGEEPELKEEFLKGQVNYAQCPKCGMGGMLTSAIVYHDPAKELLITYVPSEMGLSADQQEKYVGSLVSSVMDSLPPEQRKGYFFQPKTALTLESVIDSILEADGVSKEVLEQQRARLRLINQLLAAKDDDKTLDKLVDEHRNEMDYEFFLTLSGMIDVNQQEPREESDTRAEEIKELRSKLLDRVNPTMPGAALPDASYDEIINLLRKTKEGSAWRTAIASNRARLDYGFFQALTAKIDQARASNDDEEADALTDLRQRINDELDAQDQLLRDVEDQANLLIMELYGADDLAAALREHEEEINEVFLTALARYEATAMAKGQTERADRFKAMLESAIDLLEEDLPPETRLLNRLARAEYPDETGAVLEEHRGLLSDEFLAVFDQAVSRLDEQSEALAKHMQDVRQQIVAKMTIQRA